MSLALNKPKLDNLTGFSKNVDDMSIEDLL